MEISFENHQEKIKRMKLKYSCDFLQEIDWNVEVIIAFLIY